MATLPTLIKQCEQTLESLQKEISTYQKQQARLEQKIQTLQQEKNAAFTDAKKAEDPQQFSIALHFTQQQETRIEECKDKKIEINAEIEKLNQNIRTQFAEKKRYQILLERQEEEARSVYLKKQQSELDDLAQKKSS